MVPSNEILEAARDEATRTLQRLIWRKSGLNPDEYGFFFCSVEGSAATWATTGHENESGYLIDNQGRMFTWWLAFNERDEPELVEWEEREIDPEWYTDSEFQDACKDAGLDPYLLPHRISLD